MKVSDYIAKFLEIKGIKNAYGMSGGAIIHLVDSIYSKTNIDITFGTNEQFSAFEADGDARANNSLKPGICFATSGPGATNLLTGIATSYFDSIPLLIFTGQVARHRQKGSLGVRQLGFQELSIVDMAKHICKATYSPKKAEELPLCLNEAWEKSLGGRPGPVLIDLADDFQRDNIEQEINIFNFEKESNFDISLNKNILEDLSNSNSPLLIIGNGARGSKKQLEAFIKSTKILTLSTWASIDLVSSLDEYEGVLGTYSPKNNIYLNECDFILVLGCRLSNNIVGSIGAEFAPNAKKYICDIDKSELEKLERIGIRNFSTIHLNVELFLKFINKKIENNPSLLTSKLTWSSSSSRINEYRGRDIFKNSEIYRLRKSLNHIIEKNLVNSIFVDTGNNLAWTCNIVSENKKCPPLFSSWNNTPMGYALPGSIGYCISSNRDPVCTVIGDGGLSLCLSELAVVYEKKLPILILLIENGGHNIQKQTIETWLNNRYAGVDKNSGLCLPNFTSLEKFFNIRTEEVNQKNEKLIPEIINSWDKTNPFIIRITIPSNARSFPIVPFGKNLSSPII